MTQLLKLIAVTILVAAGALIGAACCALFEGFCAGYDWCEKRFPEKGDGVR